ncbi:MAG: ABC transporter permease [Planctomycetes bacterium]|nr:ABC transporter permease [Planctomycetota bacterium]
MPPSTLRIAWRNLGRNRKRTALALLAIAVGQFALLATCGLMHGYTDNIRLAVTGPLIGHAQVHAPLWRKERALDLVIDDVDSVLAAVRADADVWSAAARIYAPALVAPREEAFTSVVVGVDLEVESAEYGLLSGLDEKLKGGEVFLGYRLARKIGAEPGDEIAVVGQSADGFLANDLYKVRSIIKSPADLVNQSGIVMSAEDARRLLTMENQAHEIVIRARISGVAESIVERLSRHPSLAGLEVLSWKSIVPEIHIVLKTTDYVGYFVLVIVIVAAVAGIANTLMMATFERLHEFGMLLALGCRPSRIVRMILIEALFLAAMGVVAGTALGFLFVIAVSGSGVDFASWGSEALEDIAFKGLKLPIHIFPRIEPQDIVLGLIAVLVTSLVAAAWPAWIAARLQPVEAMRA